MSCFRPLDLSGSPFTGRFQQSVAGSRAATHAHYPQKIELGGRQTRMGAVALNQPRSRFDPGSPSRRSYAALRKPKAGGLDGNRTRSSTSTVWRA